MNLICSASTQDGLVLLINKYFYSSDWTIKDDQAHNPVSGKTLGKVEHKNNRWRFLL